MRRLLFAVFLVFSAGAAFGAGHKLSAVDRADLNRISAYWNSIHTMEGGFVQIGPKGGIDQGRFYLKKPGKLRFEYQPPSPLQIVSDGRTVAVSNSKLKTFDRYPLSSTPLDMLLSEHVDWLRDNAVLGVEHQPGAIVVEARTSSSHSKPNISITFSDPGLELRQWTVIDDQGLPTTVGLGNIETGVTLDDSLFVLRNTSKPVGARSRD